MSTWYSSWFPGLPSFDFSLPSAIQRRFLSFVLKKSLGHLLKPGQLDLHQIDSQIGSGVVQVRDLELDDQAINKILSGSPFRLHDGSISCVTAQIPFPNPLTSSVGLSVQSLHLTLHATPPSDPGSPNSVNLAQSVASVAETFIHGELTPREEATLRESLYSDSRPPHVHDEGHHLPGGLDSSNHAHHKEEIGIDSDPSGVSLFATLFEHLLARFEFSAVDTKIVIVHPGHSSFTLSIPEIAYSTDSGVPKQQSAGDGPSSNSALERSPHSGHIRTVSISGVTITSRDIRATAQRPVVSPRTMSPVSLTSSHVTLHDHQRAPRPVSPASSYSSIDEDTQMMMSQSIVALPPRSQFRASPSSSVISSMYQSAVSTTGCGSSAIAPALEPLGKLDTGHMPQPYSCDHTAGNRESTHVPHWATEDLVFSFGADPIVVRLQTPPSYTNHDVAHAPAPEIVLPATESIVVKEDEALSLSVSVGVMSCALRACHVRMLLEMLNYCRSKDADTPQYPEVTPSSPIFPCALHASLNIRGIVTLLISEALDQEVPSLEAFFQSPLVPPRLPSTYLRVLLENVTGSLDLSGAPGNQTDAAHVSPISTNIFLSNLSVFMYHSSRSIDNDVAQVSLPLLITDHHLHNQYIVSHCRPFFSSTPIPAQPLSEVTLPTFEVVDWTAVKLAGGSSKLSTWRVKSSTGKDQVVHSPPSKPSALSTSPKPPTAALSSEELEELSSSRAITFTAHVSPATTRSGGLTDILLRIAPLHVFFDVDMMLEGGGMLKFLDEVLAVEGSPARDVSDTSQGPSSLDDTDEEDSGSDDEINIPVMTPRQLERARERRRLERLVLEDLDLGIDYRTGAPSRQRPHSKRATNAKKSKSKQMPRTEITIILPALRAEVRCKSPSLQSSRSGGIILDVHDVQISNKPLNQEASTVRFGDGGELRRPSVKKLPGQLLSGHIKGVVLSYARAGDSKAHAFISLGSLPRTDDIHPGSASLLLSEQALDSLPIRFQLMQLAPSKSAVSSSAHRTSIIVNVPLVNVVLEKPVFDGLQIWADSVAQAITAATEETDTEVAHSRNPSMIGSRFFAKSRRVGSRGSDESSFGTIASTPKQSETAVKVIIAEALVRILTSRSQSSVPSIRPFDISASDIDVLVELKPDGKDETVITSSLMNLHVGEVSPKWELVPLLVLTLPRSLSSVPRPMVKARFASLVVPETGAKETKIRLALWGFTCHVYPDLRWISDVAQFMKAPPGVFESVVPSERTSLSFAIADVSIKTYAPSHPGAAVVYIGEAELNTELAGNSSEFKFKLLVPSLSFLLVDSMADALNGPGSANTSGGSSLNLWKNFGFASIADIGDLDLVFKTDNACVPPSVGVLVNRVSLRVHLCADTIAALTGYIGDFTSILKPPSPVEPAVSSKKVPASLVHRPPEQGMMASLDEQAFRRIPDVGNAADMISDDLPTNLDYLDESFGSAAGLRELRDDDLEDFDVQEDGRTTPVAGETGVVSNVGGETIRIIKPIRPIEHYYDTIPPENTGDLASLRDTILRVRIHDSDISLFLHDGYDWPRTRKIVEQEIKDMRKKLAKIRQLISAGQTQDPSVEETSTMLFNSIHIGLDQDFDNLDPTALVAAIDDELDENAETESHSSWQTLPSASPGQQQRIPSARIHGRRLTRSKGPSIEIRLIGLDAEVDNYRRRPTDPLISRTLVVIKDAEILDHVKTSTWRKFLTELRSDSRGNIRETDSSMVRVELKTVQPSPSHPSQETRLRAKLLPLRLYVDQDALDFLKKFFAFKDPDSPSAPVDAPSEETYIQHAEVFPIDLKLDYKPRRVDYRALREGKTIELMNFFHFDGAEMTLRHLTLHGITGWPRFFDTINDLWTPDVKATQLVDVISGVAPIRSMVNVGSGVADLVLLPIAQYKKDGRIVRGVQKGTKAFVQSTAMEAIKLGARLATGTQVILEQAESVLGGQFKDSITTETFHIPYDDSGDGPDEELISRYAAQPADVTEGVQSGYRSLQRNLHSAAQTILAVPMEVYEKSGNEGAVRAVVRAVPIAVLKPMIGASEAVGKTLMGLHNTLDPNIRHENAAKYKHR
ncbi:hypothetical protein DEU56DRAFT_8443 [Suillus clintonianus]|uniref:uncharacterized protein n=1 Tax=Suillus clintonianus TaxID=1904413 RepID=UPI001B865DBC|nr:uncharacterized protein DEU56DRAFT_8443 [Suillus clintonianus]KAG2157198.1 hypothetical protein DEU56DRAFT_8443 [Suillus clintonianus]